MTLDEEARAKSAKGSCVKRIRFTRKYVPRGRDKTEPRQRESEHSNSWKRKPSAKHVPRRKTYNEVQTERERTLQQLEEDFH